MALAWYTAIYVVWSMYLRHDAPYPGAQDSWLQFHDPGYMPFGILAVCASVQMLRS
jgi:hypothetical protein